MSKERSAALREFHATQFSHLRITEDQWAIIESQPPTRLRPGSSQLEIEVRYYNGDVRWEPLSMPMGRTVSRDNYHPQVDDASAAGGKHSRKG